MYTAIWLKPLHLQLVFADRHQAYGAYPLRLLYEKRMAWAMLSGFLLFVSLFGGLLYAAQHKSPLVITDPKDEGKIVEIMPEPEIRQPYKTPPVKAAPLSSQIRYVNPKVVHDQVDQPIEDLPTQEDLANMDIGLSDHVTEDPNPVSEGILQEGPQEREATHDDEPVAFYRVEQKPEFPGGENAMYVFLRSHLEFPAVARENGISGTVVVQFIVSATGKIENITILKSSSSLFNSVSVNVIASMPTWRPGKMNGKAVPVYFTLPLKFELR